MSSKEDARIFIGGLSGDATERQIGNAFSRFGKVLDVQIMVERDTGRPRGFGFVTFSDKRAVEAAITDMHNKELCGRQISVNKAVPKVAADDTGSDGYRGRGYSLGGRAGYRGNARDSPPIGRSECFRCGRLGHRARECPSGGGERFSSRSRIDGGGRDRFGGDRYYERYTDDRYDGGRYDGNRFGDRDRLDSKDSRYSGGRVRHSSDRFSPVGDRFSSDRYGGRSERYPSNGYNKERSFDRDDGPGGGGGDGYGSGGPARHDIGGSYRERPGPYDRPGRGSRPSSLDDDRY